MLRNLLSSINGDIIKSIPKFEIIAKVTLTSPINHNVLTRDLLDAETKRLIFVLIDPMQKWLTF